MRIFPAIVAGVTLGCSAAPKAKTPSTPTDGPSGLRYVSVAVDKLK
jgi:hypothetical protein